jgi:signal transduction histidine kinase
LDNRLSAIILHDVKNVLGELEGRLETLAQEPDKAGAEEAHRACVGLRRKLIAFLTLYKASSLGLHAHVESVPVEDFLKTLIRDHRNAAIMPVLSADSMPALGFFDEHLVGLAMESAIHNAARFAKSSIEIGCTGKDGELIFCVRDDGPGLGTAEAKPSTGLGMELCRAVAEAHERNGRRGSVSLADHPGGGAIFELRLP